VQFRRETWLTSYIHKAVTVASMQKFVLRDKALDTFGSAFPYVAAASNFK
jgi:hypothetical protein